ncbi:hypothetical protein BC828DRAFT_393104, partial [Blastocladiella britannica]
MSYRGFPGRSTRSAASAVPDTPAAAAARHAQLAHILTGGDAAHDAAAAALTAAANDVVEGPAFDPALCIECQDHPADLQCAGCSDERYCEVCWVAQHAKSVARRAHTSTKLSTAAAPAPAPASEATASPAGEEPMDTDAEDDTHTTNGTAASDQATVTPTPTMNPAEFGAWLAERCRYIPVRLTFSERKMLRLLDAALRVGEYTDKVDIYSTTSRTQRMVAQIREVCQTLAGLVVAADYKLGQELFASRDFAENAEWYCHIFELGRRHKVMNPEKMRATYGKLVYMLQDSALPEVQRLLGFSLVIPIKTVHRVLEEHDALALLSDPLVLDATAEIVSEGKPRRAVELEIRRKENAVKVLSAKYAKGRLTADDVAQLLYSVGDHHHYLKFHRDPCDQMLKYLTTYFHPEESKGPTNLGIRAGAEGARLTHHHPKQFTYVYQSLALWREIAHDMFQLFWLSDQDMLGGNGYRLRDTGQGLQRVQACPQVGRAMHAILRRAMARVGSWVGSSVIHLGDDNVPNALMFIDKYTQVTRILLPVQRAIARLAPDIAEKPALCEYLIAQYGRPVAGQPGLGVGDEDQLVAAARVDILADFFRHAFDGSGADNFSSAGSCIDGRLTSAWN